MMRHEAGCVELVTRQQPQERRCRVRVDEARRDRDVLDPQLLEVQCRRLAVYTDVRDVAGRARQAHGELEGFGGADCFDGDVGAEPTGELVHDRTRVLPLRVDH